MFLEPLRLTPVDIEKYKSEGLEDRGRKNSYSICSKEELDITLYNDAIYYQKYVLLDNEKYKNLGRTRIFPWLTSTDPHDSISKGIDLYVCQKCCTFAPYS